MVDIFFSALFLYLFFSGFHRGLAEILLKVIGWGAGLWLSFKFFPYLSSFLSQYLHTSQQLVNFFSFCLIFLPFFGLTIWFIRIMHKHINKRKSLNFFNKILGSIFSIIAFVLLVYFLLEKSKTYPALKGIIQNSKIVKFFNFPV